MNEPRRCCMVNKRYFKTLTLALLLLITVNTIVFAEEGKKEPLTRASKPLTTELFMIPKWTKLHSFQPPRLIFDRTTPADLKVAYRVIKNYTDLDEVTRIYSYRFNKPGDYLSIRFAFENNVLKWIEYIPSTRINIAEFKQVFGNPLNINREDSKYLDYYNYNNFSVYVSKENGTIFNFTQRKPVKTLYNDLGNLSLTVPSLSELIDGKVFGVVPSHTTEKIFNAKYKNIAQTGTMRPVQSTSYYAINKGLEKTPYTLIEFVFKNGVLTWVDFEPRNLTYQSALQVFGKPVNREEYDNDVDFLNYHNLVLTLEKKTNKISNIGLFSAANTALVKGLPLWKFLKTSGVKGLVIDKTTKSDFLKIFPKLEYEKESQGNLVEIFKVSDGLMYSDYSMVYFVFSNNILSSVELYVSKPLKISTVTSVYGNQASKDAETDKEFSFYTYDNLIITVDKKTQNVISIGLI